MAETGGEQASLPGANRRWAWIAVLFGAWIVVGVFLVIRALNLELIRDEGMSPYHVLVYSGLLALTIFAVWMVIRARRRGRSWREAFPPGYGALGAGLVALIATLILDVAWREGVGIGPVGIENSVAPSRVLLAVALSLLTMVPLRASLLAGGDMRIRWPVAISAGLLAASILAASGFSVVVNPWLEKGIDVAEDNGSIWLMDADGGRQTRLLEATADVDLLNPVWSPDGSRIAFARIVGPPDDLTARDYDIWVVNADGTDARPLVTGPSWQWFPRWSPDGAWVGYTDEAVGGPWISSGPVGPDVGQGPQGPVFPGVNATGLPEAELWRAPADGSGLPQRITSAAGARHSSASGNPVAFTPGKTGP